MPTPTFRYVLLDGAQCQESALPLVLTAPEHRLPLYRDLGQEAAEAGPWLYPASTELAEAAETCAQSESLRFAVSFLHTGHDDDPGLDAVAAHLHRLRHVVATNSSRQRYFLRYADNRAFSALWDALDDNQRSAVLGPLRGWSWRDSAGRHRIVQQLGPLLARTAAIGPLHLRPPQFKQILDAGRVGELLARVIEYFPEQLQALTLEQRYTGADAAWRWLETRYRDNLPLRLVVAAVTISEQTRNLADPAFESAVACMAEASDPTPLLRWRSDHVAAPSALPDANDARH